MQQAVVWDLGWALVAPQNGDWSRTTRFEELFPAWREQYTPEQFAAAQREGGAYLAEHHRLTTLQEQAEQYTRWYELLGQALPDLGMTAAKARDIAEDRTYNVLGNYRLLPGARETLEELKRRGYKLGVISDTWPSVSLQLATLGIAHLFDALTYSFELGVYKPDQALYMDALAKLNLPGQVCTFIDDRPGNLLGAQAAGMRGVQSLAEPGIRADGRFPAIHAPGEILDLLDGKPLPADWAAHVEVLTEADLPAMMALQSAMLAELPVPRWYCTSTAAEFAKDVRAGHVYGIRWQGELIAFAIAVPGEGSEDSYAKKLHHDPVHTLDFRDVMVSPRYRRRGIHSFFLTFFERQAAATGQTALYATVDPDNVPSRSSFEKAGWRALTQRSAYDGRTRVYYRKDV